MFKEHSQFYKPKNTEQRLDQVLDITGWSMGDLNTYPEGARDKFYIESPANIADEYKFLINKHKYLFKKSYTVKKSGTILYEQFWNEIIAYKLGRILGIPVPPAFIGCYKKKDEEPFYGALIEWFYDYQTKDISKRGVDIIIQYIDNYDNVKGKQHNFETIAKICTDYKVENWLKNWVDVLLFDSIIGNTDRHQNNWQIIQYANDEREYLSPAFDNGTSMGYNIRMDEMIKWQKNDFLSYVDRGAHHMKFSLSDSKRASHIELLKKIVYNYPETEIYIKTKLGSDISGLSKDIYELCDFNIDDDRYRLTRERADFILKIVLLKYDKIKKEFKL